MITRERIAKLRKYGWPTPPELDALLAGAEALIELRAKVDEALAAEREACAKLAKDDFLVYPGEPDRRRECTSYCQSRIAKAIRARK